MKRAISLILVMLCLLFAVSCAEKDGGEAILNSENTYIVAEVNDNYLIVESIGEDGKAVENSKYSVPNPFYPETEISAGDRVVINHNDIVLETYPMQFAKIYSMEYYDESKGASVIVEID